MRKNLLEFLFSPEAVLESAQTLGEAVVKLFETAEKAENEQMVANKKPLAAALKDIGINNEVVDGPAGCEIHCDDECQHREHLALLNDPDNLHKLAERGWVFARCGDQAMSGEPACLKIGFIELSMLDTPENKKDSESLETILKKAQKFATTPLEREDALNPVETSHKTSGDGQKGVGKPKDGESPKGKVKGASSQTESRLQEYGGYFCPQCRKQVNAQNKGNKPCCPDCGTPVKYPKSSSLRSREADTVPFTQNMGGGHLVKTRIPFYHAENKKHFSAKNIADSLLEMTGTSAIPAVECPVGIPARKLDYRKRLHALRKRRGEDEGQTNR